MKIKLLLAALIAAVLLMLLPVRQPALAYPEPAIASSAWQLDFTHGRPKPLAVRLPNGQTRWYWYLPYKVVNHTGSDQLFVPEITIATDAGDIILAGRDVPLVVFDAVKRSLGNHLLESPVEVVGRILQGEDQAKESVAIWPAFEHDVNEINLFITGLSGETQVIRHPLSEQEISMRKTLMLTYALPGTGGRVQDQPVLPRGERWVMR